MQSTYQITDRDKSILNIALADDDEDDRVIFGEVLEEINIRTKLSIFKNGQELTVYLSLPDILLPDLLFLDINMPIKNGLQCLCEMRNNPRFDHIFIAIYSTSSSEKDIQNTFKNGADIYINKPNTFCEMLKVVEKALRTNWQHGSLRLERDKFLLRA